MIGGNALSIINIAPGGLLSHPSEFTQVIQLHFLTRMECSVFVMPCDLFQSECYACKSIE